MLASKINKPSDRIVDCRTSAERSWFPERGRKIAFAVAERGLAFRKNENAEPEKVCALSPPQDARDYRLGKNLLHSHTPLATD